MAEGCVQLVFERSRGPFSFRITTPFSPISTAPYGAVGHAPYGLFAFHLSYQGAMRRLADDTSIESCYGDGDVEMKETYSVLSSACKATGTLEEK